MTNIQLKIVTICQSQCKWNYQKNENAFLNLLFRFLNLHEALNILNKKMIVIANVFLQLKIVKRFPTTLFKKRCFKTRFHSQHMKACQILAKSPWEHFYHIFSSFSGKLIWKMCPLVLGEILGVFVNTMTVDGRYPGHNCQNLPVPIQMQLSQKRKTFSQFFVAFLKSASNFKQFETKDDGHS